MSFPEKTRQYWLRVWGNGDVNKANCQKTFYSDNKGFYRNCQGNRLYVTEIKIEGKGSVGLPICRHHFMELTGTNIYGRQSSLYPELSWKLKEYPKNKNSFKEYEHSSETHRTRTGDWSTDRYLFDLAKAKEWEYILKHPEDKKPKTKATHFRTWVDIIDDGYKGLFKEDQEKS